MPHPTTPCPKCNRLLRASGEVTVEDADGGEATLAVYQCDECLMRVELFGEVEEAALTFALDRQGRPVDPAEPERVLSFN